VSQWIQGRCGRWDSCGHYRDESQCMDEEIPHCQSVMTGVTDVYLESHNDRM